MRGLEHSNTAAEKHGMSVSESCYVFVITDNASVETEHAARLPDNTS